MITIQMYEILNVQPLFEKISQKELPIKTAYKLTKIFDKVETELKFYYSSLTKISEEFAMRDDNNTPIIEDGGVRINPEKMEECQKKLLELSNLTLEMDVPSLSLDELENLTLNLSEMKALSKFICE